MRAGGWSGWVWGGGVYEGEREAIPKSSLWMRCTRIGADEGCGSIQPPIGCTVVRTVLTNSDDLALGIRVKEVFERSNCVE